MSALNPQISRPVICVVGPTASGKSTLAIKLAQEYAGEIISADSMQIYKGMDIGTGKVPIEEQIVPHYGIDICDPGQPHSAALFQHYAREKILEIERRGCPTILCGGTGLYIRAVVDDFNFPSGEQSENELRDYYEDIVTKEGNRALWEILDKSDHESAILIHPNNTRRVIRALEMRSEGVSYARMKENLNNIEQIVPAIFIGLRVEPKVLNKKIDDRVFKMINDGLVEEVRLLLEKGFKEALTAPQAIGYKEIVEMLEGSLSLEEAITKIQVSTRRYAKRQRTWFNKDKRIIWINANSDNIEERARRIIEHSVIQS